MIGGFEIERVLEAGPPRWPTVVKLPELHKDWCCDKNRQTHDAESGRFKPWHLYTFKKHQVTSRGGQIVQGLMNE